uniref:Uncharacterized protein n=1 Tax=Solanum lycopersicum TaxID=4081 RepID=A0A3Q7HCA8_SOLLC
MAAAEVAFEEEVMEEANEEIEIEEDQIKRSKGCFSATTVENQTPKDVWFLDSGCSNHMSGTKSLFKDLDESKKSDVRLGHNKKIQVEGEGTVSIMTSQEYAADQFLASPSTTSSNAPATSPTLEEPSAEPTLLRRSTRDRKPNPRYADNISCVFALLVLDPIFFEDAETEDKCESIVTEFKECMMKNFEMSNLGLLHYFLGLGVKQGIDGIFLSQRKYATDLLKKFTMVNCKVASTAMNINEKLCRDDGSEMENATYFRSLRFMHNPSKLHLGAAKRVLRYIAGTTEHGIWFSKVTYFTLIVFTDSDYKGNIHDRKSTFGFLFNLGSGAISWSSKIQEVVALSTSEAEYIAATSASCQAVWLRRLVVGFNHKTVGE